MGYGYGPGWGMMNGWGYGYGPAHMVVWVVIIVIVAVVLFCGWMMRSMGMGGMQRHMPMRRSAGIDVLEERYARGDINRDEYLQKKKDIEG